MRMLHSAVLVSLVFVVIVIGAWAIGVEDADVVVRIYETSGRLIRRVDLGYRSAGYYTSRSTAAYWDGKNDAGEAVASGVYFYSIEASGFTATKKLLIAKYFVGEHLRVLPILVTLATGRTHRSAPTKTSLLN